MDDLLGEDWQKPAKTTTHTPSSANAFASNYSSLRASPQPPRSGLSTPSNISRPSSTVNGTSRPGTGDAFGSLTSIKSQKGGGGVSMQERQKQMLEEKRRQQEQQNSMWDTLGSGRGTPEIRQPSPAAQQDAEDDDDILAAFNKDAPVNNASHFMPPTSSQVNSGRSTPANAAKPTPPARVMIGDFDHDDDLFGLEQISKKSNGHAKAPVIASAPTSNDDDILGDLGKPVAERSAWPASPEEPMLKRSSMASLPPEPEIDDFDAQDKPLAELVDMGFPADTARIALAENGGNLQSAVGWLLQQAHEESRQKARGETPVSGRQSRQTGSRSPPRRQRGEPAEATPAWMRQEGRPSSAPRRQDNASPANGEKDPAQIASELGNKLFKSANSIWKASQKQMAKTMAEFQQEGDANRPKWMRDASADSAAAPPGRQAEERVSTRSRPPDVTNEAALLDTPRERPQKPARPSAPERSAEPPSRGRSPVEPLPHRPSSQPKFMQQAPSQPDRRPVSKLNRQDVEDQSASAYVSPARRKRPTPKPEPTPEPEVDLFSAAPLPTSRPSTQVPPTSRPTPPVSKPSPAPVPVRPRVPPRSVPSLSAGALSTSASHRKAGGEHYKRGDYGAAHESYTAALTPLPPTHPIAIIVLSNRSLTALKTGDAKVAVSDADRVLEIIGPGLGADETIDLGGGEGAKEMKEFYGKALMRKAEALEHMEKYSDAAGIWRKAVAVGVGGAVSLRGRDRCEKAAAPTPAPKPAAHKTAPNFGKTRPAKSLGDSMHRPTLPSANSGEAIKKLRAANAAAEKADDEKFALSDSVDAKLAAWKGGKADNLRALLQSMDVVLWPNAGWKKVGMADLVMPGKVKIVYMKAIGKVHPDKIPQNATTEQQMISAAVFATLNEAWDRFKTENGL